MLIVTANQSISRKKFVVFAAKMSRLEEAMKIRRYEITYCVGVILLFYTTIPVD
jgi:hypothetical protein